MITDPQRASNNLTQEEYEKIKQVYENENLAQFPSVFQQARNLAKQMWTSGLDKAKGRPFLSTPEKAAARMAICETCEFLKENRCLKCGCYMSAKIHLESSGCPINKWGPDLQKLHPQQVVDANSKAIPRKDPRVDLQNMPKEDVDEMNRIADSALEYDGRFVYKGKQYKVAIGADNLRSFYEIFKTGPMAKRVHDMSVTDPRDQVRFNKLIVEHQKPDMPKVFSFKKMYFHLTPGSDGKSFMIHKVDPNNIPPDFPADIKLPPLQD